MIHVMTAPEEDHDPRQCDGALARAFGFLGKRWNALVLNVLSPGPAGFAEIRRAIGPITDSVLSDRLSELVEVGLVTRQVSDSRPPGVLYDLTPAGRSLCLVLDNVARWARENLSEPAAPH
jgi:DNA-binding HxlR family transcriptional regulator